MEDIFIRINVPLGLMNGFLLKQPRNPYRSEFTTVLGFGQLKRTYTGATSTTVPAIRSGGTGAELLVVESSFPFQRNSGGNELSTACLTNSYTCIILSRSRAVIPVSL
jgi:hypothetical protein